jgi:hypothetical protein
VKGKVNCFCSRPAKLDSANIEKDLSPVPGRAAARQDLVGGRRRRMDNPTGQRLTGAPPPPDAKKRTEFLFAGAAIEMRRQSDPHFKFGRAL